MTENKLPKYEKPISKDLDSLPVAEGVCITGRSASPANCTGPGLTANSGCGFGAVAGYCISGSGH